MHRDIKPANLMLDKRGTIKILDLGLALSDDDTLASITREHDEKVLGTADYLAPEQARDSHKADSRSDIYALGCTLYYLLVGKAPFAQGKLAERIRAHLHHPPPTCSNNVPMCPPRSQNSISGCWRSIPMLGRNRPGRLPTPSAPGWRPRRRERCGSGPFPRAARISVASLATAPIPKATRGSPRPPWSRRRAAPPPAAQAPDRAAAPAIWAAASGAARFTGAAAIPCWGNRAPEACGACQHPASHPSRPHGGAPQGHAPFQPA